MTTSKQTGELEACPLWTVCYNIVSSESDAWIGTGWEFFNDEANATACYQRHQRAGNVPTKRPFYNSVDVEHLGVVDQQRLKSSRAAVATPPVDAEATIDTPQENASRWITNKLRPEHRCKPLARAVMMQGRDWWIGELLEPVAAWPNETHCLHMKKPLKDVSFLCNSGDFEQLLVLSNVVVNLESLPWLRAASAGAKVRLQPPFSSMCSECGGSGKSIIGCAVNGPLTAPCPVCGGVGRRSLRTVADHEDKGTLDKEVFDRLVAEREQMPRRLCSVHDREEFKYEPLEHEPHATPSLPSAPPYDGSMTPEQLERAALVAESRGIDIETAQELVYLRDRASAPSFEEAQLQKLYEDPHPGYDCAGTCVIHSGRFASVATPLPSAVAPTENTVISNHVFTCSACARQWTVDSNDSLECFFVGLCYWCICEHEVTKEEIDKSLRLLTK